MPFPAVQQLDICIFGTVFVMVMVTARETFPAIATADRFGSRQPIQRSDARPRNGNDFGLVAPRVETDGYDRPEQMGRAR